MSEAKKSNGQRLISAKRKKRAIQLLSATLVDSGWLGLMYFLWISYNIIGIFLSVLCIFAGDVTALFKD